MMYTQPPFGKSLYTLYTHYSISLLVIITRALIRGAVRYHGYHNGDEIKLTDTQVRVAEADNLKCMKLHLQCTTSSSIHLEVQLWIVMKIMKGQARCPQQGGHMPGEKLRQNGMRLLAM